MKCPSCGVEVENEETARIAHEQEHENEKEEKENEEPIETPKESDDLVPFGFEDD